MHRKGLAMIAGIAGIGPVAMAQGQGQGRGQAAPFITHQLKPNVYWVEGGGGNSGVIVGDKGVIVIDAKTSAAGGKELLEDIAKITPKPVTTVILTHSDGDHVNGLASFPAGIKIIAHENNKKEQEDGSRRRRPRRASGRSSAYAGGHEEQRESQNRRREDGTATTGRPRIPAAIWWFICPPTKSCSPATSSPCNFPIR